MKHQIATNPDQSKRLLACGVDPDSADMLLYNNALSVQVRGLGKIPECATPAWSLSALLEVMPKHLEDFPLTKWYPPFIEDEIWEMDIPNVLNGDVKLYSNGTKWIVDYDWDGFNGTLPQSENPIEAVVLAIELLHANGYTLNTK
ncbi:MAG: hypothetical protein HDS59_08470 [Barnesiella sp.]|nr:hypothetical protein [Barnesiella sp.]